MIGRADYAPHLDTILERNRAWLGSFGKEYASYLMGETSILLLKQWFEPDASTGARLEQLIAGNLDHPARELDGVARHIARGAVPARVDR